MERNLDGCYFRTKINGKWKSVCFTDLDATSVNNILQNKSEEWLASLESLLWDVLSDIYRILGEVPLQFTDMSDDIKTFNGARTKILLLRALIRVIAEEYNIIGGEE